MNWQNSYDGSDVWRSFQWQNSHGLRRDMQILAMRCTVECVRLEKCYAGREARQTKCLDCE